MRTLFPNAPGSDVVLEVFPEVQTTGHRLFDHPGGRAVLAFPPRPCILSICQLPSCVLVTPCHPVPLPTPFGEAHPSLAAPGTPSKILRLTASLS